MISGRLHNDIIEATAPVVFGKPGEPTAKLGTPGWIMAESMHNSVSGIHAFYAKIVESKPIDD